MINKHLVAFFAVPLALALAFPLLTQGCGGSVSSPSTTGTGGSASSTTSSSSAGGGSGGSAGSGGLVAALCTDVCACQGCTSNDLADCEQSTGADQQNAGSAGCAVQFSAYLACAKGGIHCQQGHAVVVGCDAELAALEACTMDGGSPFSDPCQNASHHLQVCLEIDGGTGDPVNCTGQTLCSADCINAASCTAIKDAFSGMPTDQSKSFIDCTTTCSSTP